jgi:hypothetical protein
MIHIAMWLVTCAVAVYVTGIITGALFSLFSKYSVFWSPLSDGRHQTPRERITDLPERREPAAGSTRHARNSYVLIHFGLNGRLGNDEYIGEA